MNFLLDVNASGAVARWLIHLGHDVAEVGQKNPRMSDNEILSWAVKENPNNPACLAGSGSTETQIVFYEKTEDREVV
ncbi:hypothetical protein BuS5_01204 [Desulfosarcina sp. BuS5]|uniref:DUF5615 family PIN-like protein n=1 Tax=Desulfosarcina sp. BuS5 TaxID=933262 RepID=UPI00054ED864|nr:DUF5615 family PIN-like protein [Desulfosarcina sp. BuS5]WDN88236.1 hypothetical protein BuS5_01204 [Desulfosarcina sp. BuS5]